MELPDTGKHCSEKKCNQLDFLPITCKHCKLQFCAVHFKVENHTCTNAPHDLDVRAPVCPLCGKVVPIDRGQDPNLKVNKHIADGCPNESGNTQGNKAYSNKCTFGNCKKSELVPIICNNCNKKFCIKHRLEADHQCIGKQQQQQQRSRQNSSYNNKRQNNVKQQDNKECTIQ